jgi:DNA repair protein RadB
MENSDNRNKISCGNFELNKWLFGGYDKDIITTIYGPAGCGKTNFCMMASASAARHGGKVIFIDTEGGFSVERFRQLCKDAEESKKALENIIILKPTSFEEQWDAFGKLLKEIKSKNEISLIVVDGMTMLYRLLLAESKEDKRKVDEINSILARQMRMLAEIARKRNIPVLATNQVYYDFLSEEDLRAGKEKNANMVGGDIMRYWSKCIIELKNNRGRRSVVLRKHRSLPEKELDFEIVNEGIRKKGWL